MAWDDGATAEEYADERGEQRQAVRRGDEDYDYGHSRHADGPMHYSGYAALEGWREQW